MPQELFLKKGDEIRIIAPAKKIEKEEVAKAVAVLEAEGYKVSFGKNTFGTHHQFSGTDAEKLADLKEAISDINVKAIWSARGGYGSVRIIDQVDWNLFQNNKKLLTGYSDITVFHSEIQNRFIFPSLHAPMPISFKTGITDNAKNYFLNALQGDFQEISFDAAEENIKGISRGKIIGGNLSILYSLMGSQSLSDSNGKILFIEDLDEYLYHLDRMMNGLKRAGFFEGLAGVIVGAFSDMKDNDIPFGKSAEQIIKSFFEKENIPVALGFPAGHIENNHAIAFGMEAELTVNKKSAKLKYL